MDKLNNPSSLLNITDKINALIDNANISFVNQGAIDSSTDTYRLSDGFYQINDTNSGLPVSGGVLIQYSTHASQKAQMIITTSTSTIDTSYIYHRIKAFIGSGSDKWTAWVRCANSTEIPTVGNGTITITQGGVTKGTFTTNQNGNVTIDIDGAGGITVDSALSTTSENPVQNKVITPLLNNALTKTTDQTVTSFKTFNNVSSGSAIESGLGFDYNSSQGGIIAQQSDGLLVSGYCTDLKLDGTNILYKGTELINGTTGKIPNTRLNIDQTFDPTSENAQSGVAISGAGYINSSSSYVANSRFDGQWVSSKYNLGVSSAVGTYTYNLSSTGTNPLNYLPDDDYDYEVYIGTAGNSSDSSYMTMRSDLFDLSTFAVIRCSSNARIKSNHFTIPIGKERSLTIINKDAKFTTSVTVYLYGYRRIGTNE